LYFVLPSHRRRFVTTRCILDLTQSMGIFGGPLMVVSGCYQHDGRTSAKADEQPLKEKAHQNLVGFTQFSSGNDFVALGAGTISLQSLQNYGASRTKTYLNSMWSGR